MAFLSSKATLCHCLARPTGRPRRSPSSLCLFPQPRRPLRPGQTGKGAQTALCSSEQPFFSLCFCLFKLYLSTGSFLSVQTFLRLKKYQTDKNKQKTPLFQHFSPPSSPSPFVLPSAFAFTSLFCSVFSHFPSLKKYFFNVHSLPPPYSHPCPSSLCQHWVRKATAFIASSGATVLTMTKTDPGGESLVLTKHWEDRGGHRGRARPGCCPQKCPQLCSSSVVRWVQPRFVPWPEDPRCPAEAEDTSKPVH